MEPSRDFGSVLAKGETELEVALDHPLVIDLGPDESNSQNENTERKVDLFIPNHLQITIRILRSGEISIFHGIITPFFILQHVHPPDQPGRQPSRWHVLAPPIQ